MFQDQFYLVLCTFQSYIFGHINYFRDIVVFGIVVSVSGLFHQYIFINYFFVIFDLIEMI
jgi:hypothetical protein